MPIEIERKYRVLNLHWQNYVSAKFEIHQGYISTSPSQTIRVRCSGSSAWITLKGKARHGKRLEYEYSIPVDDALEMLEKWCSNTRIHKTRHHVMVGNHLWEVDVFHGENNGLIIAEVELNSIDETFIEPEWVDKEVTDDHRYSNSSLSLNPFKNWS